MQKYVPGRLIWKNFFTFWDLSWICSLQETAPPVFLGVTKERFTEPTVRQHTKETMKNVHFLCSRLLSLVDWHDPRHSGGQREKRPVSSLNPGVPWYRPPLNRLSPSIHRSAVSEIIVFVLLGFSDRTAPMRLLCRNFESFYFRLSEVPLAATRLRGPEILPLIFQWLTKSTERFNLAGKSYGYFSKIMTIFHPRFSALQVGLFLFRTKIPGFPTGDCRRKFGLPKYKFSAKPTVALVCRARFFSELKKFKFS